MTTHVSVLHTPSLLARFFGLLRGRLFGAVRDAEGRHPRAVYERAIETRLGQYEALRAAAAGILYLRNRLDGELVEGRRELERLQQEIARSVRRGDDDAALSLIAHRQALEAELGRARTELARVREEAEEAKENLLRFRDDIRALERERLRSLSLLANASARRRMRDAIDGTSLDADIRALEGVREQVARAGSEREIDHELGASALEDRLREIRERTRNESAVRELDELRGRLRPDTLLAPPDAASRGFDTRPGVAPEAFPAAAVVSTAS